MAEYNPSSPSPPAIVLQRGDSQLRLMAFTYCWSAQDSEEGICSDGEAPPEPEVLEGTGPIELYFPFDDYEFESRFWDVTYTDELPGPSLTKVGDHWELDPPNELPAIVEVFGFNLDSDVIVSFLVEN